MAVDYGAEDAGVEDFAGVDLGEVVVEDDEVGEEVGFEAAFDVLAELGEGGALGVGVDGLGEGDFFLRFIQWSCEAIEVVDMHVLAMIFGVVFLAGVLPDAFQTIILPRRPVGRFRITRLFFLATWGPWTWLTGHWPWRRSREQMYSFYGPSTLLLSGVWAVLMMAAYALIHFGMQVPFHDPMHPVTWRGSRELFGG